MTSIDEVYKCNVCGNVVKVVENGVGVLVCCGQEMELQKEEVNEQQERNKVDDIFVQNNVQPEPVKEKPEENTQENIEEKLKPEDELYAKHHPIITKEGGYTKVSVGAVEHPMTNEHHLKWIDVNIDGSVFVKKLNVGDKPYFEIKKTGKNIIARTFCNKHGIWKSQI